MSATLILFQKFLVSIDETLHQGGDRLNPTQIALDGHFLDLRKSVADDETWDVWAAITEDPLTEFDFLWIESDYDVFVELTVDRNNSVGTEELAFEIKADVPFVLGSNVGRANHTTDFGTGTDDVIDRIRIRNESGSTAAVRVFMAT